MDFVNFSVNYKSYQRKNIQLEMSPSLMSMIKSQSIFQLNINFVKLCSEKAAQKLVKQLEDFIAKNAQPCRLNVFSFCFFILGQVYPNIGFTHQRSA